MEILLSAHISHLLGVLRDDKIGEVAYPLSGLTLRGFVSALFFVAGQFEGIMDVLGKRLATSRRNAPLHTLLCRAQGVFDSWPENFYNFLDWRREQFSKRTSGIGLQRDFHEYKAALYGKATPHEFGFLRAAFEDYLRVRWTGGMVGNLRRMRADGINATKFFSRKKASKILGIPGVGVDALLESNRLSGNTRTVGRTRLVLIDAESVAALKAELDNAIYLREVKRLLGLSGEAVAKLTAAGLLRPVRGPTADGNSDWQFNPVEVTTILRTFAACITQRKNSAATQSWSFLHATRRMRQVGVDLPGFVRCVLDGSITPSGRNNKPGLPGFEFDAETVASSAMARLRDVVGNVVTLKMACAVLQTDTATLVFLAHKGIFPALNRAQVPRLGLLIAKADFERFKATYALLSPTAFALGTSSTHLRRLLARCDVRPVSGPEVDGGKTDLFFRDALEALDLSSLLASSEQKVIERTKSGRLLTVELVAQQMDISSETVHQLVSNGVLRPHNRLSPSAGLRFSKYAAEKLRCQNIDYTGLISTRVAAKLLGKSISNFHEYFVRPGLLVATKANGHRGNLFFRRTAVEALAEG